MLSKLAILMRSETNKIYYNTLQYNTIVDAPYVTSESEAIFALCYYVHQLLP